MQSRDQFEEYMRVVENKFYETVKLPKSPYVDAKRKEGDNLPMFPPTAHGSGNEEEQVKRGKTE